MSYLLPALYLKLFLKLCLKLCLKLYLKPVDSLWVKLLDPLHLRKRLRQVRLNGNAVLLRHFSEVGHQLRGAARYESWRHDRRDQRVVEFLRDELDEFFCVPHSVLRSFLQVIRAVPVHGYLRASRGRVKGRLRYTLRFGCGCYHHGFGCYYWYRGCGWCCSHHGCGQHRNATHFVYKSSMTGRLHHISRLHRGCGGYYCRSTLICISSGRRAELVSSFKIGFGWHYY